MHIEESAKAKSKYLRSDHPPRRTGATERVRRLRDSPWPHRPGELAAHTALEPTDKEGVRFIPQKK
jgi:hypothetical protein